MGRDDAGRGDAIRARRGEDARRAAGAAGDPRPRPDTKRASDPVDREATRELVEEVLRTALALEEVMAGLLEELPPRAFAGEDNARVLLGMVVGSAHPAARAAGLRDTRSAIALVGAIRERVIADLHTAAELAKGRD